jgi:serine/threonine-protein phosphatase PP1 catalytic subunit
VTIFTAPNYCGDFENLGAILHVSKDMKCSIEQFEAQTYCKSKRAKRSITPIPQQPRSTSPLKNITNEKNNH